MTTLKVGIASYAEMKARTMAVARGKRRVRRGEPKVWFTSMESFAKILSDKNRALLVLIVCVVACAVRQFLVFRRSGSAALQVLRCSNLVLTLLLILNMSICAATLPDVRGSLAIGL